MTEKRPSKPPGTPTLHNRRATHDFIVLERVEAGIALKGSEVKSLRLGEASLSESYARIDGGQVSLYNFQIQPYKQAHFFGHDPKRVKQLLLHRREIKRLESKVKIRGQTLIPLRVYFNDKGRAKVELALAQGKKHHDRRQSERRKEDMKEIARATRRGGL